ncbi:MAG: DUF1573 domain-containing protein, partial [Pirellulales bacterium]
KDATSPLELSFAITNRGDKPIEITSTRPGCGCTVARLSKRVASPGERITVSIKVSILGRLGRFDNQISLDVRGWARPITVPVRGTVVQDLWLDGPMLQWFEAGAEPTTEKLFDIHTVDWPEVKFDWSILDKGISVEEISRSTIAGETVIKLRLKVIEAPKEKGSITWPLILAPLDKRIRSLTLPIAYYRPSRRSDKLPRQERANRGNLKASMATRLVSHERISVGAIPRGEARRFQVFRGATPANITVAGVDDLPEGTEIKLLAQEDPRRDSLIATIRVAESAPVGMFDGRVRFVSGDGPAFSVAIAGITVPQGADAPKKNVATRPKDK